MKHLYVRRRGCFYLFLPLGCCDILARERLSESGLLSSSHQQQQRKRRNVWRPPHYISKEEFMGNGRLTEGLTDWLRRRSSLSSLAFFSMISLRMLSGSSISYFSARESLSSPPPPPHFLLASLPESPFLLYNTAMPLLYQGLLPPTKGFSFYLGLSESSRNFRDCLLLALPHHTTPSM